MDVTSEAEWDSLQAVLLRAKKAIQRAKNLSDRFAESDAAAQEALALGALIEPATATAGTPARVETQQLQQDIQTLIRDDGAEASRSVSISRFPVQTTAPSTSSGPSSNGTTTSPETSPRRCPSTSPKAIALPPIKSAAQRMRETRDRADLQCTTYQENPESSPETPAQHSDSLAPAHALQPPALLVGLTHPIIMAARRLAELQAHQNNTLSQLLGLRLEQLRLRQQQLAALQELLRAEAAIVEGTPLQMSAVHQALSLLAQSLEEMGVAAAAITASGAQHSTDIAVIAATVSCADARAEDISRMARQLLEVLREYPRRIVAAAQLPQHIRAVVRGATDWELASLPTMTCDPQHPLLDEPCAICLAPFTPGDHLKSMQCTHAFHDACLEQWLRIKAACPLCKTSLPGSLVHVAVGDPTLGPRVGQVVDVPALTTTAQRVQQAGSGEEVVHGVSLTSHALRQDTEPVLNSHALVAQGTGITEAVLDDVFLTSPGSPVAVAMTSPRMARDGMGVTGQRSGHSDVTGQRSGHSDVTGQSLDHSDVTGQSLDHSDVTGQSLDHSDVV